MNHRWTCLAILFAAFAACTVQTSAHAATAAQRAPFSLPPLPYAADALEPAIDAQTMSIHHGRHHKAYVDNLNAALQSDAALAGRDLDSLLAQASTLPAAVRNNGGGHWNHSLFWSLMAPQGSGGEPSEALLAQIQKRFGSLGAFKEQFAKAAAGRFGSGWAWLVWTPQGLQLSTTPNQDNPLMDVAEVRGTPLLAVDVWEHAYYLKYQNKRAEYLNAWWSVVNWNEVNRRFEAATGRK